MIIIVLIHKWLRKLINERRKYHEATGYNFLKVDDSKDDDSMGKRKIFSTLDLLLLHERNGLINEKGLLNEMNTFSAASHHTTTVALETTLLLLAENEEMQEMARNEAFMVLNQCGGVLTMDDIRKLEYIDRCIHETMRLFPPIPMFGRTATKDVKLKNHVVAAGADIIVLTFDIHRDPKYWSDPLKFDPGRFLPENIQKRHPFAYIPFSAGIRNCIGNRLAVTTLKALVANILYNFELEPVTRSKDIELELAVTLKLSKPTFIKFIKLKKN